MDNPFDVVGDDILFAGEVVAKIVAPEGTVRENLVATLLDADRRSNEEDE